MFEKQESNHVLGLEIDGASLKGAALSYERGRVKIEALVEHPLPVAAAVDENVNVKPLYKHQFGEPFDALIKSSLVVSQIETQDILVRPLEVKLFKERDINAVLQFQAEPLLPYPSENALVRKVTLSRSKEGSKLTLLVVRKDHLTEHLRQWEGVGIEPEVVTAAPQALSVFAKKFGLSDVPLAVLHIGNSESFCISCEDGALVAAQFIPHGLDELLGSLDKTDPASAEGALLQGPVDKMMLESLKFKESVDVLRTSVMRTVYGLAKQLRGKEVNDILIVGPGASMGGLAEMLAASLKKNLVPLKLEAAAGNVTLAELQTFALPIGEALCALPGEKEQVNFRDGEFAYSDPWKRMKKPLAIYVLLCLAAAAALVLFGKAYVAYQEAEIRKEYLDLLGVMNKPFDVFEKELVAKGPLEKVGEVVGNPKELTPEDIRLRLGALDKEISATPQLYPLLPNIPLVSDVLAWLTNHPSFTSTAEGEDVFPGLQIESFNYTVVKRPEPTKKQDKYQVKVELEFSGPTPKMAREFHDALIAPNEIVDPKGEIKWSSNKDRYRTSFFLKDKTVYNSL